MTKLLVETNSEVVGDKVLMKQMENRLRKLRDEPEIPYTDEEQIYVRMNNLRAGRKTRRNRKQKTKKRKLHRKRRTHRRK